MDHRIKLYIEKTGILLAVYLLLKYLLPLVFPFFLAWLTVSLLASASRHFHRKLLPFTASVVAMFFFFTAATLKLTGWLLLEPCKDLIPELQTQLQTWINEYADLADWIPFIFYGCDPLCPRLAGFSMPADTPSLCQAA